jgi:hypothetical protein
LPPFPLVAKNNSGFGHLGYLLLRVYQKTPVARLTLHTRPRFFLPFNFAHLLQRLRLLVKPLISLQGNSGIAAILSLAIPSPADSTNNPSLLYQILIQQ